MNAMSEGGWKRGLALGAATVLGLLGFLDAAAQAPRSPTEALSAQGATPRVASGQVFFGDAKYSFLDNTPAGAGNRSLAVGFRHNF